MKSLLLWTGVFLLGISPIDMYIARGMPNALFSIFAIISSWPVNRFDEAILLFGVAMYPALFIMAASYFFIKCDNKYLIFLISIAAVINFFTFIFICLDSGDNNLGGIFISIVAIFFIISWAILSYKDASANKANHSRFARTR